MKNTALYLLLLVVLGAGCTKDPAECPAATDTTYALNGFAKINAGETFRITVTQDAAFSVKASGCQEDLNDLDVKIGNGNVLELSYRRFSSNRNLVEIFITMPQLQSFSLSGSAVGKVSGFAAQPVTLRTAISGEAHLTVDGTAAVTQVDVSGKSTLVLKGAFQNLSGFISGKGYLNTYEAAADEADVSTAGEASARIKVNNILYAAAAGNSRIYYKGNASLIDPETSGTARIIHE